MVRRGSRGSTDFEVSFVWSTERDHELEVKGVKQPDVAAITRGHPDNWAPAEVGEIEITEISMLRQVDIVEDVTLDREQLRDICKALRPQLNRTGKLRAAVIVHQDHCRWSTLSMARPLPQILFESLDNDAQFHERIEEEIAELHR